ncbi:PLP-dependent aminotransferase family protein [Skermania sp. ID1734]|uniref:MocR-like pyridoxine biosynthesis transcription factor PdxR n=1 Tax=Skermania sp. ID1734 TaxID=2597516 RepID=UPI00117E44CA|nr:PLP-dependent aminotransferase family protein [Skermania sp. ID1734]TSD99834.1 PLP-dependent aminotransferase family protein [Skermania sp. ID1734]
MAGTPLSVQLADALRAAASDGHLRVGDRLPSSRGLAQRLDVSRTVTAAAYEQLHAEGWIRGRHGSGTYVAAVPEPAQSRRPAPGKATESGDRISLIPGAPCLEAIDSAAWRRAWRAAADRPALLRPIRTGLPEFHDAVVEHLLRHRGLAATDAAVLATAGTSSATFEVASVSLAAGSRVAIEEPGYGRAAAALQAAGMRLAPIRTDEHGICVDAIPADVSAVYCTPAHQYPLGARLPAERRVELVRCARKHSWLLLEDDYDGELRYDTAPLPLLASIGPDVVVHLGTTSKILTPTLGAGWMVAPPAVAAAVAERREAAGMGPSPAGQRVFVELARSGDLARHLRRLRRELATRRSIVVDSLRAQHIDVRGDAAGSHVVIELPSLVVEERLIRRAGNAGILLDGLARHHFGEPRRHGIVLGYTACSKPDLAEAVANLADAFPNLSVPCRTP